MAGFGGVAEYGITVRWDKNFLKMARLLVERRSRSSRCSAACASAGRSAPRMPSRWASTTSRSPPARASPRCSTCPTASRAACARRRTSSWRCSSPARRARNPSPTCRCAFRSSSWAGPHRDRHGDRIARLLPGAGREIPRALRDARRGTKPRGGAQRMERGGDGGRRGIPHARARDPRRARRAAREGRAPRILELLQSWGGATIAYRKRLVDSPSYTLNHEEVEKALEEGIRFAENLTPTARRGRRVGRRALPGGEGAPRRCGGCGKRATRSSFPPEPS